MTNRNVQNAMSTRKHFALVTIIALAGLGNMGVIFSMKSMVQEGDISEKRRLFYAASAALGSGNEEEAIRIAIGNLEILSLSDNDGKSLLHYAIEQQRCDFALWIISKFSAIPEIVAARDKQGQNALHKAAVFGDSNVALALILCQPELVDSKDNGLQTPLHLAIAASEAGDLTMIQLLLRKNADIAAQTCDGKTALLYAINYKKNSISEFLIDHYTKQTIYPKLGVLELVDFDGNSPLHRAAFVGLSAVVMKLLSRDVQLM